MLLEACTSIVNSLLAEPYAGLLNGILFGVKATVETRTYQSLVDSGTLHIIALSGMNISILVGVISLVLLRFVRRPIASLASVFIIIGFIVFVGISPSIVRAGLMAALSAIAIGVGRQIWPFFTWIVAVTIMLLINPLWIADISFQLSTMATLGIILFGNARESRVTDAEGLPTKRDPRLSGIRGRMRPAGPAILYYLWPCIKDDLRVTLAAQICTIPIILVQFHRISLVSPLSNILIGWLMAPIMIMGLAMVAVGLIWLPLAIPFAWALWVPLTYIMLVIEWTAKLPFASISL
jgi:competence protein ComEC